MQHLIVIYHKGKVHKLSWSKSLLDEYQRTCTYVLICNFARGYEQRVQLFSQMFQNTIYLEHMPDYFVLVEDFQQKNPWRHISDFFCVRSRTSCYTNNTLVDWTYMPSKHCANNYIVEIPLNVLNFFLQKRFCYDHSQISLYL